MTNQLGFLIEQNRCMGCKTCQIACKDFNDLEIGLNFRIVIEHEGGDYFSEGEGLNNTVFAFWLSLACNHCADPACVKNCPTGAMYKEPENGLVLHQDRVCIGCQICVWSCPYEAPKFDKNKGVVRKCDYCIKLLTQGKDPICVSSCPTRALHAGKIEDLKLIFENLPKPNSLINQDITHPSLIIYPHKRAIK